MDIIRLSQDNIILLKNFLSEIGKSSENFRYFKKRSLDIIQNHIVTLIGLEEVTRIPVCYGHLDRENNTIWLGVCVIENQVNKGYGKMMMTELINEAKKLSLSRIKLSVDKSNRAAISLYKKFNFEQIEENKETLFFSLKL